MNTHGSFIQQAYSQPTNFAAVKQAESLPVQLVASSDDAARRLAPKTFQSATAEEPPVDDGTIRLTPDKSKIVRLDNDAASVIVSNPANATVLLDTPRVLVVIPRAPGATSFTVLDIYGNTIMEKNVIVTGRSVSKRYVRVRKMCGDNNDCVPNAVYYCPDGCFEVATQVGEVTARCGNVELVNLGIFVGQEVV